jgi:hypothetical protein
VGVKDDAAVASQKRDQITEENRDAGLDDPHADWGEYVGPFAWCHFDAAVLIHELFLPVVLFFVIEQGEFHLLAVPGACCCQAANFHTRLCT